MTGRPTNTQILEHEWPEDGRRLLGKVFAGVALGALALLALVMVVGDSETDECIARGGYDCPVGEAILLFWVGIPLLAVIAAATFGAILGLAPARYRRWLAACWLAVVAVLAIPVVRWFIL